MQSWIVFKQDTEKKPHQMVGSVYAVDAEIALLEARTVYARRPKAVSMWVAPTSSTLMWTHEDVARASGSAAASDVTVQVSRWQVFRKTGQRRAMTFVDHVGLVEGETAEQAMHTAITRFTDEKTTWVWMVVPDAAIARSDPDDVESWFMPALSKTYKQQSAYGSVGLSRRGRSKSVKIEDEK